MSKSLTRVIAALRRAGLGTEPVEVQGLTRTAGEAAAALGVGVDQIAKSIVFCGETSGEVMLFLTAGGNRVDGVRAAGLAGEPLGKADAALIRAHTGFAIGGVSPVGHTGAVRSFLDRRLMEYDVVWCAAGTPRHNFPISPSELHRITGAAVADFADPAGG